MECATLFHSRFEQFIYKYIFFGNGIIVVVMKLGESTIKGTIWTIIIFLILDELKM